MKSLLISLSLVFTVFMGAPVLSQAGVDCSQPGFQDTQFCREAGAGSGQTSGNNRIIDVLQTVITILTVVVGVAAVIGVIIGGFQMTTGGGNPESVSRGRRTIIYALVGLAAAILARTIIVFVLGRL